MLSFILTVLVCLLSVRRQPCQKVTHFCPLQRLQNVFITVSIKHLKKLVFVHFDLVSASPRDQSCMKSNEVFKSTAACLCSDLQSMICLKTAVRIWELLHVLFLVT